MGQTGVGKSSLANVLINMEQFKVSGQSKSETDNTHGIFASMSYKDQYFKALVIDTPGFGDSEGRDSKHIAEMVLALKAVKRVHAFVVCLNSSDVRISENKQGYLKLIQEIFGPKFFENVIIAYTHWQYGPQGTKRRLLSGQPDEKAKVKESIEQF